MTPMHEMTANLLDLIWRGMSPDYKGRYRMTIWQQFEDQIRSSAYTSTMGRFLNSVCLKLQADLGRDNEDRQQAQMILNAGQDRALLKLLRDETTLLVLMVRVRNQERREEWEREQAEKAAEASLFGAEIS